MPDVSRALTLPDVGTPSDGLLKSMAVYWDQLVVPDYLERLGGLRHDAELGDSSAIERTEAFAEMEAEGIIVTTRRDAELAEVDDPPEDLAIGDWRAAEVEDEGNRRWISVLAPIFEMAERYGWAREENPEVPTELEAWPYLKRMFENIAVASASQYLNRVQDALELAVAHNLAPVGHTALSHIGCLVGDYSADAPMREAALVSAALEGFHVAEDTPGADIVAFRDNHRSQIGRFRASLVDLAADLRGEGSPITLLAAARDTYRNRVEPALGDLEAAMKESRLRFFLRSLVGAASLTLIPVDPIRAIEGGAELAGRTISYRFSREALVRQHPYGLAHSLRTSFPAPADHPVNDLDDFGAALRDPRAFITSLFSQPTTGFWLMREFWASPEDARAMFERTASEAAIEQRSGRAETQGRDVSSRSRDDEDDWRT